MERWLLGKILSALSIQQVVTFVLSTLAPLLIAKLVPPGDLQTTLLSACASLLSLLMVVLRKPSTSGGSALSK
jgi:hypothetical protein